MKLSLSVWPVTLVLCLTCHHTLGRAQTSPTTRLSGSQTRILHTQLCGVHRQHHSIGLR